MNLGNDVASIATQLAEQEWNWEQRSVESTLSSLGWRKAESIGHRETYTRAHGPNVSVYHNGDRPDLIEVTVAAFPDVDSLSDIEYEKKVDELYDAFVNGTKQIASVIGEPEFLNGAAASDFPEDQDAVWLSLWNRPSARIMLQQKHEDRELPFRICIVVAPRDLST